MPKTPLDDLISTGPPLVARVIVVSVWQLLEGARPVQFVLNVGLVVLGWVLAEIVKRLISYAKNTSR